MTIETLRKELSAIVEILTNNKNTSTTIDGLLTPESLLLVYIGDIEVVKLYQQIKDLHG